MISSPEVAFLSFISSSVCKVVKCSCSPPIEMGCGQTGRSGGSLHRRAHLSSTARPCRAAQWKAGWRNLMIFNGRWRWRKRRKTVLKGTGLRESITTRIRTVFPVGARELRIRNTVLACKTNNPLRRWNLTSTTVSAG